MLADWETRQAILRAMYNDLGPEGWFEYRHGKVCHYPRNGISTPARWVKWEARLNAQVASSNA